MAHFGISGIWKSNSEITHYGFHKLTPTATKDLHDVGELQKMTKAQAVALLQAGHTAQTMLWDYTHIIWNLREHVHVVDNEPKPFLRSNPDNTRRDNLKHLINYTSS